MVSIKGRLKAAGLPTTGRLRFVPRRGYRPTQPLPRGEQHGYIDRFGNEWVWDQVKGEWDVQLSHTGKAQLGWASPSGDHVNVSPRGKFTH
jgi:filamentous hemagglutinin